MSYQVLALKYRPQTFVDLVGQEHVGRTLGNAIASGRIHHAFLFTGARGVGKTSAARIFAKALNCEEGLTATPCNVCPSCVEITKGNGIDVFEIDGASNTGVDDIRELRDNIRYLPSRSRYKLFIIDEVHMLSINAFNALLKTLEEPPAHAKFIFATTEPHKIPVTILSRCQRFDFRKIAVTVVVTRLRQIVDAEKIAVSDRALTLIARRGEGSMRDALSTLDQVIAFCGAAVADEDVLALLGMVDRRLLLDTAEGIVGRDSRLALEALRRVDHLGHSFRQFCLELVEIFRALVLLKVAAEPGELLDVTGDELRELKQLADRAGLEEHQRALTLLMKTEAELATSSFPRLALEMTLVRLTHLPPARDVATLVAKLEELERRLASGASSPVVSPRAPVAVPRPPVATVPVEGPPGKKAEAPAAPAVPQRGWPGLVEHVRDRRRPAIAAILEQASLLAFALPQLQLGLPRGSFALEQLQDREYLESLHQLAAEYFAQPVQIVVSAIDASREAVPPSLVETKRAQESDRERRLREEALDHPLVKAVCDIFGAEIKEIKAIDKGGV